MKNIIILCVFLSVLNGHSQTFKTATTQAWKNGAWVNDSRTTNSVDGAGFVITELRETWKPATLVWEQNNITQYTNTPDGRVSQSNAKYWSTSTNTWNQGMIKQYSYNADKKLLSVLSQFLNSG